MSVVYIIFFISLNYLVYNKIACNNKTGIQVVYILIFLIIISLLSRIHHHFYVKSYMINDDLFFTLLVLSVTIPIISILQFIVTENLRRSAKEKELDLYFFEEDDGLKFSLIVSIIITFMQLIIILNRVK